MKKLTPCYNALDRFIYLTGDGETIADISYKLCVPVETLISSNRLTKRPTVGQALYVDASDRGEPLGFDEVLSSDDYPFKIVKNP